MWKPKSIIIVDPGLSKPGGHYYTQDFAIAREAQKLGIPVTIYCRTGADLKNSEINVVGLIRLDIYAEIEVGMPEFTAFENFFVLNDVFYEDLKAIPSNGFSRDDLVYFPSILQNHIEGVADWIVTIPEDKRPHIALTLRVLNSQMDYNLNRGLETSISFLYRCVLWKLLRRHPRTKLFADTLPISLFYSQLSHIPVTTLPIPQLVFNDRYPLARGPEKTGLNILYIGNVSIYRGCTFIPTIIDGVLSLFPDVLFTIQVQAEIDSDIARTMTAISKDYSSQVQFIFGTLAPDDYLITMKDSDIILLPYKPSYYSHGSSGVFTEAAALGKVIVVTAGTVMETVANDFDLGAVISLDYTAEAFVAALNTAILDFEELNRKALVSGDVFAAANSPEAFIEKMLSAMSEVAC